MHKHLRRKRVYRYPRGKRKRQRPHRDKTSIHERAEEVNSRSCFGHWEGDLIQFRNAHTNMITLRERKTRFLVGIRNMSQKSETTSKSLIYYMKKKADLVESLTLDNDPAFAGYQSFK